MELQFIFLEMFPLKPVERFRTFRGSLPSVYLFLIFNIEVMFHALFPDSFLIRTTCKRFYCVSEGHIWLVGFVSELWVVISFQLIQARLMWFQVCFSVFTHKKVYFPFSYLMPEK